MLITRRKGGREETSVVVESGKDSVSEHWCVGVITLSVGVTVVVPVPLEDKPGRVSFLSLNQRIGICRLSNVPGHVVEKPC